MRRNVAVLALAAAGALGLWAAFSSPQTLAGTTTPHSQLRIAPPDSLPDLIEGVRPAVVNIQATGRQDLRGMSPGLELPFPPGSPFEQFFRRFGEDSQRTPQGRGPAVRSAGSGFLVDPDGYVVTNNHVIEHAEEITVILDDGKSYGAELVGRDAKTDLALLKIEGDEPFPYVNLGDSDEARVGEWVVAIGNPFGLGGSATTGIISARGRDIRSGPYDDFLQIDAAINSGNSGGPLFDTAGEVIGINSAIVSPNGGNVGIGFAIPASQAAPILDQLREQGRVERGWLGVTVRPVDDVLAAALGMEDAKGALISEIVSKSPAARAGLKPGDVILSVEGDSVTEIKDLSRLIANTRSGSEIAIGLWRKGEPQQLQVILGSSEEMAPVAAAPKAWSVIKPS